MAADTNRKQPGRVKRNSTTGCLTVSKSDKRRSVSTKTTKKKESTADQLFQRAWKDTYEKRDRRVG